MAAVATVRQLTAATLVLLASGLDAGLASAGTATAAFEVKAQVAGDTQHCRGAGEPVSLACGPPLAPTVLQTRPTLPGLTLVDGWITYGQRAEAYDSVYAASLTTRVIRYEQWEYIETLVSW